MHSEVFTPHPLMPSKLRKRDLREKPRNLLQSDEQCPGAPLSHLRKIPSATSGSNKGVKIVPKALSGLLLGTRGTENFTQCLTRSTGRGLTSGTSFEPIRESDPRKF